MQRFKVNIAGVDLLGPAKINLLIKGATLGCCFAKVTESHSGVGVTKAPFVNFSVSKLLDCFSSPRLAAVGLSGVFVLMATIGQGYAMKGQLWLAIQSAAK